MWPGPNGEKNDPMADLEAALGDETPNGSPAEATGTNEPRPDRLAVRAVRVISRLPDAPQESDTSESSPDESPPRKRKDEHPRSSASKRPVSALPRRVAPTPQEPSVETYVLDGAARLTLRREELLEKYSREFVSETTGKARQGHSASGGR
eukprot:Polyplicarium_translucidae@DN3285_c0_g1_i2.p1